MRRDPEVYTQDIVNHKLPGLAEQVRRMLGR
jgi:hypothetical protein